MTVAASVVLALLFVLGIREPIRKKLWRELIVYVVFFLFGSALLIAQAAGARLPFIIDSIESFFKNTLHFKL